MRRRYEGHHILLVSFTSFYGMPLLRAAHARGVRVTLLGEADLFERFPDVVAAADGRIVADLQDEAAFIPTVMASHRDDPFTALFVSREPAVIPAALLGEHLGIPWNSRAAGERIRDKWLTRQVLAHAGFRQPEHVLVDDAVALRDLLETRGGGWVAKPRRGTGSTGVSRVERPDEAEPAVAGLREAQPRGPFLVERCVEPAHEFSVEGVWLGREPCVLAVTAKTTSGPPHYIELGHTLPAPLEPQLGRTIVETATGGLRTLGLGHGLFHVEVFVDEEGVVFGEAHARAGGDRITTLLELVGYDLYGLALEGMFAQHPEPPPPARGGAAVRYFSFPPGRLVAVSGTEALEKLPAVRYWRLDVAPGEPIRPPTSSGDRHGCVVVTSDTAAYADEVADDLVRLVRADVLSEDRVGAP